MPWRVTPGVVLVRMFLFLPRAKSSPMLVCFPVLLSLPLVLLDLVVLVPRRMWSSTPARSSSSRSAVRVFGARRFLLGVLRMAFHLLTNLGGFMADVPGSYRLRTYRPELDSYWRVLKALAGPDGDVLALHERCRAAGAAPRYARKLTPARKAALLGPKKCRHCHA